MHTRPTVICTALLALVTLPVDATWAFGGHAAAGVGGRTHGGAVHGGRARPGHVHHGQGAFIHDRIGSGFADARIHFEHVRHQRHLHDTYRRSGLLREGPDFHAHHPYPGSVPYRAHSGRYGRYGDYGGSSITIVTPPAVVLANPYFCEVCAVGFAGDRLFYSHLGKFHDVPEDALDSACVAVGDQLVFAGY
jgi:hypothetical protein